jgi:hypothetical protein
MILRCRPKYLERRASRLYVPDRVRGEYRYQANLSLDVREPLSAVEVRFLTFDVWGQHVRTLKMDEVVDINVGKKDLTGEWRLYSENECSEYYASIGYVSRARTKAGRVLEADPSAVIQEARKFSKKFTEADLEPKAETK